MSENDKVFTGSIPEFYDTYLVPLIFEEFANDLAHRVCALSPSRILEIAAGSGVVTRALAPKLKAGSHYCVTDLNQAMLDHAKTRQKADPRIRWQQADALNLPYDASSFDVAICQFGVMFFPDRIAGYKEARRTLTPDGALVFNVWDDISFNEFADVVTDAAAEVFPDAPPRFLARTPHGYHDISQIEEELRQAGFSQIRIETLEKQSSALNASIPAIAYCQGTPLRNEIEQRDPDKLAHVTDVATKAIAARFGDGPVNSKIRGHVITAFS
ncbi:class I SAM-dependent methyltransferase [Sneathiella aquimaris]|uniref:class I SAM-dependent methyltransferase n=1 Tax=Sneathiella aquimaris TaxID=2599305 RepID=UPI00146E8D08|nr:class I SAM-dependent methyltransferase [Sneathiella aquimaris]